MKRNSLLIATLFITLIAGAQSINLHLNNGMVVNYNSSEVDYIDFSESSSSPVSYTSCPDGNHPHLIDLGLPSGTKWACCNVGAQKPEDYGGYFAWGETTEKSYYYWNTYIHCDGSIYTIHDIGMDIAGSKDIAGTQYDAATANWGSSWVMPNKEQMEELNNSCTSEWTTENGVKGRRFTGPNGATIFLPAAGDRVSGDLYDAGSHGHYWSSSIDTSFAYDAWGLYFGSVFSDYCCGLSVRPVKTDIAPHYPDLQLSETQISLDINKGNSTTVRITAGSGEYIVTNLNSSVAKATSLQGTTITIIALSEGDAKVVATDMQTGQEIIIEITVTADIVAYTSCPDSHHPHLIDLGLPSGTKWACCNVGAQKPEDYGGYFAWGETWGEKSYFEWITYSHCDSFDTIASCHDIGKDIAGIRYYDAATANWGIPWVMPNKEQMEELKNSCTSEWTTENGVKGRRFTGTNGASIFLPAAGSRWSGDLYDAGEDGYYWSSSLYDYVDSWGRSHIDSAWRLEFDSKRVEEFRMDSMLSSGNCVRYGGLSVRPVRALPDLTFY